MTDDQPKSPSGVKGSNLYQLCRTVNLLENKVPDFISQAMMETAMSEMVPRSDDDSDDTRIFIHYTMASGQSLMMQVLDAERMDRTFDIDTFLEKLYDDLVSDPECEASFANPVEKVGFAVASALTSSVFSILEVGDDVVLPQMKQFSMTVLMAMVAALYDDPLDVMIVVKDPQLINPEQEGDPLITNIWRVKERLVGVKEVVTIS